MIGLTIEGIGNIFGLLWPLLTQYPEFYYWKSHQFNLLNGYHRLQQSGLHLTRLGMIYILESCYSPLLGETFRDNTLDYWLSRCDLMFNTRDHLNNTGHSMLQYYHGRGNTSGVVIGVRVVFPKSTNLGLKYFSYAVYGTDGAISSALVYRDFRIGELIKKTI